MDSTTTSKALPLFQREILLELKGIQAPAKFARHDGFVHALSFWCSDHLGLRLRLCPYDLSPRCSFNRAVNGLTADCLFITLELKEQPAD